MQENENSSIDSSQIQEECQTQETENAQEEDSQESLKNKIKELEDQYLRTYADFENTKKRRIREKDQALE